MLHDILNTSKQTKNSNSHYSPILHECMNTCRGKERFKIIGVLLDSVCSPTILIRSITTKHKIK